MTVPILLALAVIAGLILDRQHRARRRRHDEMIARRMRGHLRWYGGHVR